MDAPTQTQFRFMALFGYATKLPAILTSVFLPFWVGTVVVHAETKTSAPASAPAAPAPATSTAPAGSSPAPRPFFIQEYRVTGSKLLTPAEIGETVYPFLGPGRTVDDVEGARAALEKGLSRQKAIRPWSWKSLSNKGAAESSFSPSWKTKWAVCASKVRPLFLARRHPEKSSFHRPGPGAEF